MLVQIAYIRMGEQEAVLRSTPDAIQEAVARTKGEVLFKSEAHVHSGEEELVTLWTDFVIKAKAHGKQEIAEQKCEIFFRKGNNLWTTFEGVPNLAIFTAWTDDMFIQVSKRTGH